MRAPIRLSLAAMFLPALALAQPPPPAKKKPPAPQAVAASKGWHAATPGKTAPTDDAGRAKLVLQALNTTDRVELRAASDKGGFSAEDLDRAAHVMRDTGTANEHPVDPHLLDLIYRVQTHFKAHEIRIISGYRTPHAHSTSNHGKGRAMDLVVPGTSDDDVAKWARDQGFCGVGTYPVSGFVHLDVRERSFFWVDTSGPHQKNRTRGILADQAHKSDGDAEKRGEKSVGPFQIGGDVDAVCPAATRTGGGADVDDDNDEAAASGKSGT